MSINQNEIVLFEDQNIKLEVNIQDETVWLTQKQIALLFSRSKSTINEHIKNIYKEAELYEEETMTKFGNSEFADKPTNYYNLDMIISIGYRVKSKKGIIFRRWANKILKSYLIQGYAINNKRLEYLEKTVKLINIASRVEKNTELGEIIKVINEYSKALNILDDYDHKKIIKPKGTTAMTVITYEQCLEIINELKLNNKSDVFALERKKGLESIIKNIYQSFDNKCLYSTIEEKAANFLYLIIKNHIFIDGNKRIAAALFIFFLEFYDILYKNDKQVIDSNTLVAIILLIAQSDPNEKEILIDLVMNFLNQSNDKRQ